MIALVTAETARELDTDLPLLVGELPEAEVVVWDDPAVDWSRYDAVIIRSTWDYHERRSHFVDWARRVSALSPLWNPLEVIEWNTDKRYLAELAKRDIPVVPTTFVAPGTATPGALDLGADLVVKPTVGAGSVGVIRTRGDADLATNSIAELHAAGLAAMIQPYLDDIDARGETGLVFLGGEFSHAFGKDAILNAPVTWEGGLYAEETITPRDATADQLAVGHRVIEALPATAYARVDLLPGVDGPVVLEVELTEPSLFLHCDKRAPRRAAEAFRALAATSSM